MHVITAPGADTGTSFGQTAPAMSARTLGAVTTGAGTRIAARAGRQPSHRLSGKVTAHG
jgi:hypothetical protein